MVFFPDQSVYHRFLEQLRVDSGAAATRVLAEAVVRRADQLTQEKSEPAYRKAVEYLAERQSQLSS